MIQGSANINERSQNGQRDTEIAFGAWQPALGSNGAVQAYRLQIWSSHLGLKSPGDFEMFRLPENPQTVRLVQDIANRQQDQYLGEENVEMEGHLIPYPYKVGRNGEVQGASLYFEDSMFVIVLFVTSVSVLFWSNCKVASFVVWPGGQ